MKRAWGKTRLIIFAWVLMGVAGATAQAQGTGELPLTLTGSVDMGFSRTATQNGFSVERNNPLTGVRLDLSGYWHHPKFLTFSFRPQFTAGRQSSEAIFPQGNGLSFTTTFLGGRAFPLTVSYTRLTRKLVTYGALNRLAGLENDTSQSALGVNWDWNFPGLPKVRLNFSKYADQYDPLAALTSASRNRARVFSVGVNDRRWGWDFDSQLRFEKSRNDLFNLFNPSQAPYLMRRNLKELRATGTRELTRNVHLGLSGGKNVFDSWIQATPLNQDYVYGTADLAYKVGSRLSGSTRGGFTSNLLGYRLEQALGQQGGPNLGGGLELLPLTARVNLMNVTSQLGYALSKDFHVNGQVSYDATQKPKGDGIAAIESTQTTGQFGTSYSHAFRRWRLGAHYAANLGSLDYGTVGPSRTRGHQFQITTTTGSAEHLELGGSAWASRQDVIDGLSLHSRSGGAQVTVTKRVSRSWTLRGGYTYERSTFNTLRTQYDSSSHGLNFVLQNRWFDLSGGRQSQSGLSFQPDLLGGIVSAERALILGGGAPLLVVPSSLGFHNAAFSLHPFRRFTARGTWSRNRQFLLGRPSNNFDHYNLELSYQFRLLKLSAGYTRYSQSFGLGAYGRSLAYFLVSRDFRLF